MTRDGFIQAKLEAEQRAKFKATLAGHTHPEAFCIMAYQCRRCRNVEHIWNSRDGVSPFMVDCPKCDGDGQHVAWQLDWFRPEHKPLPGERIFVDFTREHALEAAPGIMARSAASGYPYEGTPEEFAEMLLKSASPGSPHTLTVTTNLAVERGVAQVSTLRAAGVVRRIDEMGRLVLPKELRDAMDIPAGTRLEFLTSVVEDGQAIVLRKFDPQPFGKGA